MRFAGIDVAAERHYVAIVDEMGAVLQARGYRWFRQLASGIAADTLEIAKREGVGDSYVRRLVPLALLAPEIIEAICAGR